MHCSYTAGDDVDGEKRVVDDGCGRDQGLLRVYPAVLITANKKVDDPARKSRVDDTWLTRPPRRI